LDLFVEGFRFVMATDFPMVLENRYILSTVDSSGASSCGFVSVVILRKKCAPSKISLYFYIRDRTQPAARPSILPVTPQRTDVDLKLFNRTFPDHIITMVSARGRNDHGDMMQCLYQ
jgi:hypothetical protein